MNFNLKSIAKKIILIIILFLGLLLRIKLFPYKTHWSDMYFWKDWGEYMAKFGPANFYQHFNADYLPLYPLVLGLVHNAFEFTKHLHNIPIHYFYKLPASMVDILLGLFIFKILRKKSLKFAFLALILFLFNPAIFANSAMWGQVDVIGTLFIVLGFYFFIKKNFFLLGASLGLALCTKPLYLLSLPIFVIGSFLVTKSDKKYIYCFLKKQSILFATLLIIMWLISLPFVNLTDFSFLEILLKPFTLLLDRYRIISERYLYTSVNAFNFWGIIDRSFWLSDARIFASFSYYQWGNFINIFIICLVLIKLFFTKKEEVFYKMNLSLLLLFFSSFMFLTRIHERHLYYIFPFLLITFIYKKRFLISYFILSLIYILNLHFSLEYYYRNKEYVFSWGFINFLSLVNFLIFLWIFLENFVLNKTEDKKP